MSEPTRMAGASMTGASRGPTLSNQETELPASIGKVARRELAVHGITRLAQLAERSERELLDLHGVGPKAVRILHEELRLRGWCFRE